jgi:exonuclease SbcD
LHRADLLTAQGEFVDFLVGVVRAEAVDVVLVAGDLYDRALPPVDAVRLCDEALRRLADTGAQTVIISGNHDSARRLGFGADLIAAAGVHLRTDPRRVDVPVLLGDPAGPVAVYALPYLEPEAVRADLDCDERGHEAVVSAAMARVRTDLRTRPGTRSVVVAHALVTGAEECDSERDISVGGVSSVPASVFGGADYVALGHLHGAQTVRPHVRYSGSPLAYSFSEERQTKVVHLVDLPGPRRPATVTSLPCPVPRRLATLRGRLDDLLTDPALEPHESRWLAVTLTDAERPREAMSRLQARFPFTLQLAYEPAGMQATERIPYAARLRGRSDLDITHDFVAHVRGRAATAAESGLLARALEDHRLAEAHA